MSALQQVKIFFFFTPPSLCNHLNEYSLLEEQITWTGNISKGIKKERYDTKRSRESLPVLIYTPFVSWHCPYPAICYTFTTYGLRGRPENPFTFILLLLPALIFPIFILLLLFPLSVRTHDLSLPPIFVCFFERPLRSVVRLDILTTHSIVCMHLQTNEHFLTSYRN